MKTCPKCSRSEAEGATFDGRHRDCIRCRSQARRAKKKGAAPRYETPTDLSDGERNASARPITPPTPQATPVYVPPLTTPKRVLVLADVHVPEHDARFWAAVVAWLGENHVDTIVLLGDFMDQESVNHHGGNPNQPKWKQDTDYAKGKIKELAQARPDARIVYVKGNHEGWIDKYVAEVAPALYGVVSLPDALGLAEMGIDWVTEERQPYKIGNLWLIHGHQLRGGGMNRARKLALDFGVPGVTVVMGHDHRPQHHELPNINGNTVGIVLACGRTLKPKWQKNEANGWVHGMGVFDVFPSGEVFRHLIDVKGGRLTWGDRVYSGAA